MNSLAPCTDTKHEFKNEQNVGKLTYNNKNNNTNEFHFGIHRINIYIYIYIVS